MTGLLYLIVVGMWGLVFVPIYLRNHDHEQLENELNADDGSMELPKWRWARREAPTAKQKAFIRRRRVFMMLLTLLVAVTVGSITGSISAWWIIVPVALNLGFIGLAASATRQQVRRVSSVRQPVQHAQVSVDAPAPAPLVARETTIVVETTTASRTWKPVESPLPSYVTAERATSYTRGIESDKPWTSQEMLEQAAQLREERTERIRHAQQRLEEARALAMEKARRAALAANAVPEEPREKRAVGE